jgi:hypothetical protein
MLKLNPKIEEFLNPARKGVKSYKFETAQMWFIDSNPEYYNQDGPPPVLPNDTICILFIKKNLMFYYFEGKRYLEEEILRIINLKAFI